VQVDEVGRSARNIPEALDETQVQVTPMGKA
jgi:hypothetical protein